MFIISVSGSTGAGKDTAANYIAKKMHLTHISGGDVVRDMLHTLKLAPSRYVVRDFSIFLRKHFTDGFIIQRVIDQNTNPHGVVTSGLRTPTEADEVLKRGGIIIYIEANLNTRYQRIHERARTGDVTEMHQLKTLDAKERGSNQDEDENLGLVKRKANHIVINEGSLEEFYRQLDVICEEITKA